MTFNPNWTIGGITDLVDDLSPSLGGNLDLAGNDIISPTGATPYYVRMQAGTLSSGGGAAGYAQIRGGDVGASATQLIAGQVTLQGGNNLQGSGQTEGGKISIVAGAATASSDGDGGDIEIKAGSGGQVGGDIFLRPGYDATDHTSDGNVILQPITSGQLVELQFREDSANGTEYIGLSAPASVATSRTWQLPDDDPASVDGYAVVTDSAGVLGFSAIPTTVVATLQTTTNTPTVIASVALPSDSALSFTASLSAWDTTGNQGAQGDSTGWATNTGGTSVIQTDSTNLTYQTDFADADGAGSPAFTATANDGTDEVEFTVTGETGRTVNWKIEIHLVSAS